MGKTGFGWLRVRCNGGFLEYGNKPLRYIESRTFFDRLSDYQLFK
jgi:hypothetical protein